MARDPIWKSIAATLEGEIAQGAYRPGDKLPTEAEMARRFGVNRHTVRRALADLSDRRVTHSRRGSGVFVCANATDYPIGRRVRFHKNMEASGRLPGRQILRIETRPALAEEASRLHLQEGAPVVVCEGLSLASDQPIAHFISLFPAERFPELARTFAEVTSVTEALKRNGLADYLRASTRITAERATPTQVLHLGLKEGDALLKTSAINTDTDGRPVEYGQTWFAGPHVALTIGTHAPS